MDATDRGMLGIKAVRYGLIASAALLVCAVLLPANWMIGSNGLMAKAGNLVVAQAFADDSESTDISGSSGTGSGSGSGSSDCLVCVDTSSISSSAFSSSSSSESDSKSKSDNSSHKVSICHYSGNSGNQVTLSIDDSAVPAHLALGDTYGDCSNTIPTCAALTGSGTVTGIWVPSSAVGNDTALNTYFADIQSGTSSNLQACSAANASQSYRDIHGQ